MAQVRRWDTDAEVPQGVEGDREFERRLLGGRLGHAVLNGSSSWSKLVEPGT